MKYFKNIDKFINELNSETYLRAAEKENNIGNDGE